MTRISHEEPFFMKVNSIWFQWKFYIYKVLCKNLNKNRLLNGWISENDDEWKIGKRWVNEKQ